MRSTCCALHSDQKKVKIMDMNGTEVLLGPIGASPLDLEPLSTGYSGQLSTDEDGRLIFLPLFWGSRRWGFWTVVKGATVVALGAIALLALRRYCLRYRRARARQPLPSIQTLPAAPVSPISLHKGKWTIVPSPMPSPLPHSPIQLPEDTTGSPVEEVTMEFGFDSDDEREQPIGDSILENTSPPRSPVVEIAPKVVTQVSEEFNLTFTADSTSELESDPLPNGEVISNRDEDAALENDVEGTGETHVITSKAMVTIL